MEIAPHTPKIISVLFIDSAVAGASSVGPLTRLGAWSLLDQQIGALVAAGLRDIVLWADQMPPVLGDIVAQWREKGVAIAFLTDRSQVAEVAKDFEYALVMANNVVATSETIAHALATAAPSLFVRDAATSDDRHERIDLNDRWTGLALLPVEYLNQMPDIAEDWSVQSALLRHAVQKGVARKSMAIGPAEPWQSEALVDLHDVERWQDRLVQAHFAHESATATLWRHWVSLPLARAALPMVWSGRAEAGPIVYWSRFALVLLAIILALLQWPIAALLVLIPVTFLEEIHRQNGAFLGEAAGEDALEKAYWIAWALLPVIALMSAGENGQFDAFLLGAMLSISTLVSAVARLKGENWVVGRGEALILLLGAAIAGLSLTGGTLMTSFAVLLSGFWRPIWMRLKAI